MDTLKKGDKVRFKGSYKTGEVKGVMRIATKTTNYGKQELFYWVRWDGTGQDDSFPYAREKLLAIREAKG